MRTGASFALHHDLHPLRREHAWSSDERLRAALREPRLSLNWLFFLPIMALVSLAGALIAVVLVRWIAINEPFLRLFREIGPIMIIAMVAGTMSFLTGRSGQT